MDKVIRVGVSNRHVHLREDTYKKLFKDVPFTKKYDLNQVGEFASNQTVLLRTSKDSLLHVRVVGPFREYDQVEIFRSDAKSLGLTPPVRRSGDLEGSASLEVIGEYGSVFLEHACILANRHVHMSFSEAEALGLSDNERVQIVVQKDNSSTMDAYVKISDNGFLELHLDKDDANSFGLNTGDEVIMKYGDL